MTPHVRHRLGGYRIHGGLLVVSACLCHCQLSEESAMTTPAQRTVIGRGAAHYVAATGQLTFQDMDAQGALLDSSDALPGAYMRVCEPTVWNPGTRVLSANVKVANRSAATTYLSPVEWRLTGVLEAGVISGVNTALSNAGCGRTGLTLANDDLDHNGRFDCIGPDDTGNTADDPGWDFSSALGADNALAPGQDSACRLAYFTLTSQTSFTYYYAILGVVDDGWPPAPSIDPVTSPTSISTQTLSGRCVTTKAFPDQLNPDPSDLPATNVITILGGVAQVDTPCADAANCLNIGGLDFCGAYSASVSLRTNTTNNLEISQALDTADRGPSSFASIVHDGQPPQVVASNPPNNAVGVAVSINVVVTFSEIMQRPTIDSTNPATANIYLLQGTTRQNATVTLDAGGTQAFLDPTIDLANDRTFQIVVTTGVRDLVGHALASQWTAQFTTAKRDDTVPPQVSSVQPVNGATAVDRRTAITVTFSEAILNRASTDPLSPTCVDSGTVTCTAIRVDDLARARRVPGTRSLSSDATTVTLVVNDPAYDSTGPDPGSGTGCVSGQAPTAAADLDCDTPYQLTVSTAIADLAGNGLLASFVSSFRTGIDPDLTPPSIQSFNPPPGATGVATGVTPEVLFSEAVSAATVNGTSVFLKRDGIDPVAATVSLTPDGLTARLQPASPLNLGTRYVLFVQNSITDIAGNHLASPQNTDFTTMLAPDTTPPSIVSVSPADGAANVSVNPVITVVFSEAMNATTVNTATVKLNCLKDTGGLDYAVAGSVHVAGDRLSGTFTPATELKASRLHQFIVEKAVADAAGNPLTVAWVSTFRTIAKDLVPPCVTGVGPADGSTSLPTNVRFALAFSEALLPASVVPSAFDLRDHTGTALNKSFSLSPDYAQVLIIPASPLPTGAVTLQVLSALRDNSGQQNALDQGSSAPGCLNASGPPEPIFSFDVSGSSDTTRPTVVSLLPLHGSTGVSLTANIVVSFSEPMNPLSLNDNNIGLLVDASGNRVGVVRSFSPDVSVATLDPTVLLGNLTTYRITVAGGGAMDLAGNTLASGQESIWTTLDASSDTTPPTVTVVCPADNATKVSTSLVLACNASFPGQVVISFSEPLNSDTVVSGNIRLLEIGPHGHTDMTQSVALQGGGMTVTITPIGTLKKAATYHIRISPLVTDLVGLQLQWQDLCQSGLSEHCTNFGT